MPEEDENEHMDDFVCYSADRVDYRLQRVSRCRRTDPLVTGVRRNLFDLAFCDGTKRGLITLSTESFDGIRATDPDGPLIPSVFFRRLQHEISASGSIANSGSLGLHTTASFCSDPVWRSWSSSPTLFDFSNPTVFDFL